MKAAYSHIKTEGRFSPKTEYSLAACIIIMKISKEDWHVMKSKRKHFHPHTSIFQETNDLRWHSVHESTGQIVYMCIIFAYDIVTPIYNIFLKLTASYWLRPWNTSSFISLQIHLLMKRRYSLQKNSHQQLVKAVTLTKLTVTAHWFERPHPAVK